MAIIRLFTQQLLALSVCVALAPGVHAQTSPADSSYSSLKTALKAPKQVATLALQAGERLGRKTPTLRNLHTLDLSTSGYEALPEELKNLPALRHLITSRSLQAWPGWLAELPGLETLTVMGTHEHLPETLCQLNTLREINVAGIGLAHLPCCLLQLPHLQRMVLKDNQITNLCGDWQQLARQHRLDLSSQALQNISDTLYLPPRCQQLLFSGNALTTFPELHGGPRAIPNLALNGNRLSSLPSSLQYYSFLTINLAQNQFEEIPEVCYSNGREQQLSYVLILSGNPLKGGEIERFREARPEVKIIR